MKLRAALAAVVMSTLFHCMPITPQRTPAATSTQPTAKWAEEMRARFPRGTFEQITKALKKGEHRTDFVREAVERELERRGG
jgi:hypothetical protein